MPCAATILSTPTGHDSVEAWNKPAPFTALVESSSADQRRPGPDRLSGTGRRSAYWPKCAPKCAPKVHSKVRAAGLHWHAVGMTMAFAGKKTRIP
jgi:hypothetical protein